MVLTGVDSSVQIFSGDGKKFKNVKELSKIHDGFVNKCGLTPWDDCKHVVTVSQDKSIKMHNVETYE